MLLGRTEVVSGWGCLYVCKPSGFGHLLLAAAVGLKAGKARALLCSSGRQGSCRTMGWWLQWLNRVFAFNSCKTILNKANKLVPFQAEHLPKKVNPSLHLNHAHYKEIPPRSPWQWGTAPTHQIPEHRTALASPSTQHSEQTGIGFPVTSTGLNESSLFWDAFMSCCFAFPLPAAPSEACLASAIMSFGY